jgi:hypothetical protein
MQGAVLKAMKKMTDRTYTQIGLSENAAKMFTASAKELGLNLTFKFGQRPNIIRG